MSEFDLGYEHGYRDASLVQPVTRNAGLWFPLGCYTGFVFTEIWRIFI